MKSLHVAQRVERRPEIAVLQASESYYGPKIVGTNPSMQSSDNLDSSLSEQRNDLYSHLVSDSSVWWI